MRCEDYFSMQIYVRFPGTGPLQIIGDKNLRTTLSFHVFSFTGKRLLDAAYRFQGGLIAKCGDVAARTIYIWFPLNPRKKKKLGWSSGDVTGGIREGKRAIPAPHT